MNNYFETLSSYAEQSPRSEVVGFLYPNAQHSMDFRPVPNTTSGEMFAVDPADVMAAYTNGAACFFHSHCVNGAEFSVNDSESCDASGLPWLLYSLPARQFNMRYPKNYSPAPYVARSFVLGFQDCVSLVCDYFRKEFKVHFPFFVRTASSLVSGWPFDAAILNFFGFKAIDPYSELRQNDILLMAPKADLPASHVGVMLDGNHMLHQRVKTLSEVCDVAPFKRMTRAVFRHPDFTRKVSV